MARCSLPNIPYFKDWYNRHFEDLCRRHDIAYSKQQDKKRADINLMSGIALQGYPKLAMLTYLFVSTVGWIYYIMAARKNAKRT